MTIDINTLNWTPAPAGFDQSGTLYNTQLADIDNIQLILGLDIDTRKASLAMEIDNDGWADTSSTKDWPAFDRVFGRQQWQAFLTEWEQETREELDLDGE